MRTLQEANDQHWLITDPSLSGWWRDLIVLSPTMQSDQAFYLNDQHAGDKWIARGWPQWRVNCTRVTNDSHAGDHNDAWIARGWPQFVNRTRVTNKLHVGDHNDAWIARGWPQWRVNRTRVSHMICLHPMHPSATSHANMHTFVQMRAASVLQSVWYAFTPCIPLQCSHANPHTLVQMWAANILWAVGCATPLQQRWTRPLKKGCEYLNLPVFRLVLMNSNE